MSAAADNYADALKRLPGDRDSALPLLTQAFDTYKQVADAPESDDTLRRMAVLGMARSKEARGELSDAITQYERVAKEWPDTVDAKRAEERVKLLNSPEGKEFYTQFTAFKPKANSGVLPPRGTGRFDMGSPFGTPLPPDHPPIDGPMIPAPGLGTSPLLPSPPVDMPRTPAKDESARPPADLPNNPFAPPDAKPKDEPAKSKELPSDPFAPPAPKSVDESAKPK